LDIVGDTIRADGDATGGTSVGEMNIISMAASSGIGETVFLLKKRDATRTSTRNKKRRRIATAVIVFFLSSIVHKK